jgi:lysophospholipase
MGTIKFFVTAILILSVTLVPYRAFSIDDDEYYEENFHGKVLPYFNSGQSGNFASSNGLGFIKYKIFHVPGASKIVVIVPGSKQHFIEFSEEIYDLSLLGYSVAVLDHFGQGESSRKVSNSQIQHIDNFNEYVADFDKFMSIFVNPINPDTGQPVYEKLFIHAHSMGAAVAAIYLAGSHSTVNKAYLSSPMIGINFGNIPNFMVRLKLLWAMFSGQSESYIPNVRDGAWKKRFKFSDQTNVSRKRVRTMMNIIASDPKSITSGVSYGWVNESLKATAQVMRLAPNIKIPILIVTSPEDKIVSFQAQTAFSQKTPNCNLVLTKSAPHDTNYATDHSSRMNQMHQFFNR